MCREKRLRKAGGMQPKAAENGRRRQDAAENGGKQQKATDCNGRPTECSQRRRETAGDGRLRREADRLQRKIGRT